MDKVIGLRSALLSIALVPWMCALPACAAKTAPPPGEGFTLNRLEVGAGENAMLITDLNADGNADLLVATESDGAVVVRLGDGTGGMGDATSWPTGDNPTALDAGDVNADGHQDLIIANHERPYVTVLRGDGSGRFAAPTRVNVSVAPHPHRVKAVDLDWDGSIDLIVDSRDRLGLFALRGDGEGGFDSPGTGIDAGGAPYLGFAVGDLDEDGRADLVTPNANSVSVLLNTGTSSALAFELKQSIPAAGAFAVGLADFNGDGHVDLVTAAEGGRISINLGTGDGKVSAAPVAVLNLADGAKTLAVGDFDGDGRSDAVICTWGGGVTIISMDGQDFVARNLPPGKVRNPWGIAVGDLDRDGRDDIVVSDGLSTEANIYLTGAARE